MKITHLVCAAVLTLTGLAGIATHAGDARTIKRADELDIADVYCPAEDSCTVTYDNHRYTIRLHATGSW